MHVIAVVIFGLISLVIFIAAAVLLNRVGWRLNGARIFIWVWLVASLINAAVGVFLANVPLLNEIGAFVPIFGVPAAVAWYFSRRFPSGIA
jgi:hypothetical protein